MARGLFRLAALLQMIATSTTQPHQRFHSYFLPHHLRDQSLSVSRKRRGFFCLCRRREQKERHLRVCPPLDAAATGDTVLEIIQVVLRKQTPFPKRRSSERWQLLGGTLCASDLRGTTCPEDSDTGTVDPETSGVDTAHRSESLVINSPKLVVHLISRHVCHLQVSTCGSNPVVFRMTPQSARCRYLISAKVSSFPAS